jgi:hypothetical protein
MAVNLLSEEEEKALLSPSTYLRSLNNLHRLNLGTGIVCDRLMDENVFDNSAMERTTWYSLALATLSKHCQAYQLGVCGRSLT